MMVLLTLVILTVVVAKIVEIWPKCYVGVSCSSGDADCDGGYHGGVTSSGEYSYVAGDSK